MSSLDGQPTFPESTLLKLTEHSADILNSRAQIPVTRRLRHLGDLLLVLVQRDMKLRYKRSVLGVVWTLVNPLSQLLVFHFVFGRLFDVAIPQFPLYLFVGIITWNWFSASLGQATSVFVDNRGLIRRPGFPVAVLPVVTISSHLVHFLLTVPVLIVLMREYGIRAEPIALLGLPLLIALQFILTLGLAYVVASMHVAFRDTQYLLRLALMLAFYLTPIFYSLDMVPREARPLYDLNPMVHLIGSYRSIFLQSTLPRGETLLVLAVFAFSSLGAGLLLFRRMRPGFHREL